MWDFSTRFENSAAFIGHLAPAGWPRAPPAGNRGRANPAGPRGRASRARIGAAPAGAATGSAPAAAGSWARLHGDPHPALGSGSDNDLVVQPRVSGGGSVVVHDSHVFQGVADGFQAGAKVIVVPLGADRGEKGDLFGRGGIHTGATAPGVKHVQRGLLAPRLGPSAMLPYAQTAGVEG